MNPGRITKSALIYLFLSLFLNHLVVGQTNLVLPKYRPHLYDSIDRTYFSSWQLSVKAENRIVFEPNGRSSSSLSGVYYNRFIDYYKMLPEDPQDILYIFLDAFENDKDDFCHHYKLVRKIGLGMESYYRQQLPIMDKLCECVFAAYNPNLLAKLQRMNAAEQRDRTSDQVDAKQQGTIDSLNCVEARRIYDRYGFPDRRLVGVENERFFFRIIAHAKLPEMEEYLTEMRVAVEQGRLLPQFYAELFDQIQVKRGLPQEFGTQFQYYPKTGRNELYKSIPMNQVNENRKHYGLGATEH